MNKYKNLNFNNKKTYQCISTIVNIRVLHEYFSFNTIELLTNDFKILLFFKLEINNHSKK